MIDIKEGRIESLLQDAIDRARYNNKQQLVSITKEISERDPLHVFESAKKLSANRSFWTSTVEDFFLVSAGIARHIIADTNRFENTEKQWEKIINEAVIHNPAKAPGTGLLAIGGMSFDPKGNKTKLWENFADSSFIIPQFLFTVSNGRYFLTANIQVHSNDEPADLVRELRKREETLLSPSGFFPEGTTIEAVKEIAPEQWKETVKQATEEIRNNHADKIVLARELRLTLTSEAEITSILNNLISSQSNSFIFAFEREGDCFVGASPERLVKLEQDRLLSTCLAGTAPRGETEAEDREIGNTLLHDEKNRSEHDFVVKMIRQAMEKYCTELTIPDEPVIYPLKNLQHLYTPVTATLKDHYSMFDVIKELHPTPALGGVPRESSLAFIRQNEQLDRGWYGAPIGWLDSSRNGEFAVGIRSGLIQGNEVSLFAGCGVVKDSDPVAEYEETKIKFKPMMSVLGG